VVVMVIRRPGCVLCRYQARELWDHLKADLDDLGVGMACIVHEWMDREIEAFSRYWPGDMYLDVDKEFFKMVGGGRPLKPNRLALLNPFSAKWRRIVHAMTKVHEGNLVGQELMGGVLVLSGVADRAAGSLMYMHVERDLGLPAPLHEVLAAATLGTDAEFAKVSVEEAGGSFTGVTPLPQDLVEQSKQLLLARASRTQDLGCRGKECE